MVGCSGVVSPALCVCVWGLLKYPLQSLPPHIQLTAGVLSYVWPSEVPWLSLHSFPDLKDPAPPCLANS